MSNHLKDIHHAEQMAAAREEFMVEFFFVWAGLNAAGASREAKAIAQADEWRAFLKRKKVKE